MRAGAVLSLLLIACGAADSVAPPPAPDAQPPVEPLGAHVEPDGDYVQFSVRSERATRIELNVYKQAIDAPPMLALPLVRAPGSDVWRARVARRELPTTIYYGYRAWGPNFDYDQGWTPGSLAGFVADVDEHGNRFNPNKLLIDPYARELSHDPTNSQFSDYDVYRTGDAHRATDSGPWAPKGIVLDAIDLPARPRPTRPHKDAVIYEVHVRGLTRADPSVDEACRGTYAGAAAKASYLAALGVTAIELLPIQETNNDANDNAIGTGGDNYWGYSTLAFFAPDRRYACDKTPGGPTRELRAMVDAMHAVGISVYIDVVYNHTAEGGGSALLSWRGIDNAAYYELDAGGTGFVDRTGIGANTNAAGALMRDLTVDSLRYWYRDMGVDGFRFDLAAVLGNRCETRCFEFAPNEPDGILARAAAELPDAHLIAEPWGIGDGTYQLGNFPAGWAEWNAEFRDHLRRDQNRHGLETATLGWLANRVSGSPNLFAPDRRPYHSINYVVSHDGFTLRDLHTCNVKRNDQMWPYGPSGGGDDHNLSWDHGGAPAEQRKAARTSLALLMVSAGIPMITGGDERYRTQHCNNNPYNLDSIANWLDWSESEDAVAMHAFATRLIQFRHAHPALRPTHYLTTEVTWLRPDGEVADPAFLDSDVEHAMAWQLDGAALDDPTPGLLVLYNGNAASTRFALPAPPEGLGWHRIFDTGTWFEPQHNHDPVGMEHRMQGRNYDVEARSVVAFELR